MKVLGVLSTISASLAIASSVHGQAKPDFTGRWKLDPQAVATMGGGRGDATGSASGGGGRAGGGVGLGPPADELIIQQTSATLTVEARRSGSSAVTVEYRFDGKRRKNAMPVGRGGTAEADYSTRWDGLTLSTSITRRMRARGGTTELRYREQRYLAADGSMVVETTMIGQPAGRKVTYRKAE